jgi:ribosomal protein S18 acetylase RimI-like enzyme
MEVKTASAYPSAVVKSWIAEFGEFLPNPLVERIDVGAYADKLLKHGMICIVSIAEQPAGLAAMYANDQLGKTAYVSLLAVRPDARGHGVGAKLVEACSAHAREQGMLRMRLQTLASNSEVVRFYEHLNFVKTGASGQKIILERVISTPHE